MTATEVLENVSAVAETKVRSKLNGYVTRTVTWHPGAFAGFARHSDVVAQVAVTVAFDAFSSGKSDWT